MTGGMHGRRGVRGRGGACMAGGHAWQGDMHGMGCMACMPPGKYYAIQSIGRRYTSYWNGFLLTLDTGDLLCRCPDLNLRQFSESESEVNSTSP